MGQTEGHHFGLVRMTNEVGPVIQRCGWSKVLLVQWRPAGKVRFSVEELKLAEQHRAETQHSKVQAVAFFGSSHPFKK